MKRIFKNWFCAFLSSVILFSLVACSPVTENEQGQKVNQDIDTTVQTDAEPWDGSLNYVFVCKNDDSALYADMKTGHFYIESLQSAHKWYSVPADADLDSITTGSKRLDVRSQMVIEYIYKEDESITEYVQTANSLTECIDNGGITVQLIEEGIRVTYNFVTLGITIPVEYTLENDYLNAKVEMDSITENGVGLLTAINLLPTFGAGNWDDQGYLFVPDGSGAIVNFNNQVKMNAPP